MTGKKSVYQNYLIKHEEKYGKQPELLPYSDAREVWMSTNPANKISDDCNSWEEFMLDESGVYEIDGCIYELIVFSNGWGGLPQYRVYVYRDVDHHDHYQFPLSPHLYFNR